MAADAHGFHVLDAGALHIAHSGSPQVVEEKARHPARLQASGQPLR